MVGEARDRKRPRDRAERDDEVRVAQVDEALAGLDLHPPPHGVVRHRAAEDEVGARAHHAQGNDDVARLERPRRCFGEHRRVEHEVLQADDRRAALSEEPRDVRPREPAAEDERAAASLPIRH